MNDERSEAEGLRQRSSCPVCYTLASRPFLTRPYDADPIRGYLRRFYRDRLDESMLVGCQFELCRCDDCGLVFQRWVPNVEFLDYLYGDVAKADPSEVARRRDLSVRLNYQHDIERLVRYFGDESRTRVLDFGAGTGTWLQMAAALGCHTTACELDPSVADRLRQLGHEALVLDEMTSGTFDFINTEQVFEHLVEPMEVLAALVNRLRPGGLVRISVPNGGNLDDLLKDEDWTAPKGTAASLNCVTPLEHLNCFDHDSLTRLAVDAGLEPFVYPLRVEVHSTARLRYAVSAIKHKVRHPGGTLLYFRRPE